MSRTLLIGIGLFILGVAGAMYITDKLFVELSGLWYSAIITSIIMATIGLALMWKELGRKSK